MQYSPRADIFSWWCMGGGGNIVGIAYVGGLCSKYNTNLNEVQSGSTSTTSATSSALVSKI